MNTEEESKDCCIVNCALHVAKATRYSLEGLAACFRRERAFRIECIVGVVHLAAVALAPVGAAMAAALVTAWLFLLAAETVNSAIEEVVDAASPGWSDWAKRAKDYGSAAVFLATTALLACWAFAIWDML